MADIKLAKPYATENYTKALENLTKRYENEGDEIHYEEVAFDGLSKDQARSALKFFGDIGLIEIPKQGYYTPPEDVVTWQNAIDGPAKRDAIESVVERLKEEYEPFKETVFLLNNSEEEKTVETISTEVGGKMAIPEDKLSLIKRTIEVFAECGFLNIDSEGVVTTNSYSVETNGQSSGEEPSEGGNGQSEVESESGVSGEPDSDYANEEENSDGRKSREEIMLDLSIEMDATEMDPDDLKEKLEIIESVKNA